MITEVAHPVGIGAETVAASGDGVIQLKIPFSGPMIKPDHFPGDDPGVRVYQLYIEIVTGVRRIVALCIDKVGLKPDIIAGCITAAIGVQVDLFKEQFEPCGVAGGLLLSLQAVPAEEQEAERQGGEDTSFNTHVDRIQLYLSVSRRAFEEIYHCSLNGRNQLAWFISLACTAAACPLPSATSLL